MLRKAVGTSVSAAFFVAWNIMLNRELVGEPL